MGRTGVCRRQSHSGVDGSYDQVRRTQPLRKRGADAHGRGVVLACLLGFLQVFVESRRDQWAFLVHRPTTRTQIFLGKALAAAILYLPAMVIPWTVFVLWCARPGRIAEPFNWHLTLPGYVDILTGPAYYFAGMLTGLRQARWYASRALGLGVPIVLTVFVVFAPELWHALVFIAVATGIVGVAAWGSFLTGGSYSGQRRGAKAALGFTLGVGICAVGVTAGGILHECARPLLYESFSHYPYERHHLAQDGTVLRVQHRGTEVLGVVDLKGNAVAKYEDPKLRSVEAFLQTVVDASVAVPLDEKAVLEWNQRPRGYRSARRYYRLAFWPEGGRPRWYYLHADRCFVEYDQRTRLPAGRLGPKGYVPAGKLPTSQFGRGVMWAGDRDLRGFSDGIYLLQWDERQVVKLFEPEPGDPIIAAQARNDLIALRTRDTVYLLNKQGERLLQMPIDNSGDRYGSVELTRLPGSKRTFAWYHPDQRSTPRGSRSSLIVEFTRDGTVLSRRELPDIVSPIRIHWTQRVAWFAQPLAAAIAGKAVEVLWLVHWRYANPLLRVLHQPLLWPELTLVLISSVMFAVVNLLVCWRRAFGRGALTAWTIWGFLLGPTGLLLLLCIQDWPARVACASCGDRRRVDYDSCEHCGAPFPTPALDGTEVFE